MKYTTKKALAMAYSPNLSYSGAMRTLNKLIDKCVALKTQLFQRGYTNTSRNLTPEQVNLIFEYHQIGRAHV